MEPKEITQYAHALFTAHGDKAEAEAAQRATDAARPEEARDWDKIRLHIKELRGARQT